MQNNNQTQNKIKQKCPHCNVFRDNHLGAVGTCKKLQKYKKIVDDLYDEFKFSKGDESDGRIIVEFMERYEGL